MRYVCEVVFVLGLLVMPFLAEPEKLETETLPPLSFEILRCRIHDVDTVMGDVALPWRTGLRNQSIRAEGFDGWEVDRSRSSSEPFKSFTPQQWDAEIAKGIAGRDALRKLAEGGVFYVEWNRLKENSAYSRLQGPFWVRTSSGRVVNVRKWAIANGHARDVE